MANSTLTHPGHEHFQSSDGVIILVLGALIFVTFALGMVSQLCDKSIPLFSYFFRPRKQYYDDFAPGYTDNDADSYSTYGLALDNSSGSNHKMADLDLESGLVHASTIPSLPPSSSASMRDSLISGTRPSLGLGLPRRSTTRYGSIRQHVLDVNGVRKMVLVVGGNENQLRPESSAGESREGFQESGDGLEQSPDEYAEWYARWTRYQRQLQMQRELEQHGQQQQRQEEEEEESDPSKASEGGDEAGITPLLGPWD
ncbi:hypothetical protein BDW69DRAFT_115893 [Aspergillus filifer]